jgi:hypothetical protein
VSNTVEESTDNGTGQTLDARLEQITITDYRIEDLDSFQKVVSGPREVAALYFYSLMDFLIELAYGVSSDFFSRPQFYTNLEDSRTTEALAALRARYGAQETFLSKVQRDEIYISIFGQPGYDLSGGYSVDDVGDFARYRNELVAAANAFAERRFETGADALRARVREAHQRFKDFLDGFSGAAVSWTAGEALPNLTEAITYRILRDRGVAAVFGVNAKLKSTWPYASNSNGTMLVEAISKERSGVSQPGMPTSSMGMPTSPTSPISQERFTNLQTAALRGAEAIATIIDLPANTSNTADLDLMSIKVYTWASFLHSLRS